MQKRKNLSFEKNKYHKEKIGNVNQWVDKLFILNAVIKTLWVASTRNDIFFFFFQRLIEILFNGLWWIFLSPLGEEEEEKEIFFDANNILQRKTDVH